MTPAQLRTIHIARRQVFGADDARYRLLLRNTAGVDSSKDLTNATFEDVMAVLEDMGFTDAKGPHYWRDKVFTRKGTANPRMVHKIHALAKDSRYDLASLCERFSHHRTTAPEHLEPREAWNLIEMLKASTERGQSSEVRVQPETTTFTDDVPF